MHSCTLMHTHTYTDKHACMSVVVRPTCLRTKASLHYFQSPTRKAEGTVVVHHDGIHPVFFQDTSLLPPSFEGFELGLCLSLGFRAFFVEVQ